MDLAALATQKSDHLSEFKEVFEIVHLAIEVIYQTLWPGQASFSSDQHLH